ncbi:Ribonuclease III [Leucobacter sp. 7(1)]|uniref:ribonuclease III n=1 Tax=Leucobacter sp. 7(1) TaxID=1255613 RepID=UPI00097EA4BA|nr:ribonuclease III [Leucobacter sp. 7(1)]SJN13182.1 Ribonuclease III [Leucobacter sp. 7(1)]
MNGNESSLPHTDRDQPSGSPQGGHDGFLVSLGVAVEPELAALALTHRSWAYEHGGAAHNERLEFLGDSILGQAVTVKLYRDYPELSEGDLAKRRAALVSTTALAEVARELGIGEVLRLGKGEELTGGREKDSLLADAVEAIIGAVYLSSGPAEAERFVLSLVDRLLVDPTRLTDELDPKTTLQQMAAKLGLPHPPYETEGKGPDHDRRYLARVSLDGVTGRGQGTSKKSAELAAARAAVERIRARKR